MTASSRTHHEYRTLVVWMGNDGVGTAAYDAYSRNYRLAVAGKPDIAGSADPAFRGDADRHNPEDLFLASLSACHMLAFLALCAREGVVVTAYEDDARGRLALEPGGGGRFAEVTLRPHVRLASAEAVDTARRLHEEAHRRCFIANSCSTPVHVEPAISPPPREAR